jgi:hypothetical protein
MHSSALFCSMNDISFKRGNADSFQSGRQQKVQASVLQQLHFPTIREI